VTGPDFFISYAGENRAWAEWIAVQLERADFSTRYQAADFRPGGNFVHEMQQAITSAARTIAVLSPAYLVSKFGAAEWYSAFAMDPTGERGLLIPVRVQACSPPGLLAPIVYVDLVDLDEAGARRKLLAAVDVNRSRPTQAPFPGGGPTGGSASDGQPRFPGSGPVVSNLPPRDPVFTGRDDRLRAVYDGLRPAGSAAVVSSAVHGLGGVGKTALTIEYAHRFASDYDIVWWIDAEQPATVAGQLAELGRELGLPAASDDADAVKAVFAELRGRDRWLLIYDNAERPDSLNGLRPAAGTGHVLVTSRWPDWRGQSRSVELTVWPRAESLSFLRARTRHTDERLLGELAELVGDLPLAVEEAAAYLEQTGEELAAYVELVRDRARELFALAGAGAPEDADRRRVATVWTLSLERIHAREPVAEQLLRLLAFLDPQVPRDLPTRHPEVLPAKLRTALADRLAYNRLLEAAGRYALVTLDPKEIGTHRLVQAVIRARLDRGEEIGWVTTAVGLIGSVFPNESGEPNTWPSCQALLSHLLTVTGHAERLGVSGERAGRLLDRASTYLRVRGQYRQAEPLARRALALTETALGPEHRETAWRHDELGRVLRELGRLDEAYTEFQQALTISLAALGPDHPDIGTCRNNLGRILRELGRLDEAHTEFEQALAIGLATLGPDHPDIGTCRNSLGNVLLDLGRIDEAHTEFQRALTISLAALGPDHPTIGIYRNNLGRVLRELGRLDEAHAQVEQALAIGLAALGPDHPVIGACRNSLGLVLRDLGRLDEAHAQLAQALTISLNALGPAHPDVGTGRCNLGRVLRELGRLDEAHTQSEQALAIGLAALGPNHPTIGAWRSNLALVLRNQGRLDEARTQLRAALTISLAALGPDHPQTHKIQSHLYALTRTLPDADIPQ
jgi:tetratricopeptide (TPR) repeat protein